MIQFKNFERGVNLGGWLSQCDYTKDHYDTFIVKEDLRTIASWGLDHVRLPIDYNLVQDDEGNFIEENFSYIDNCISWCREFGLNLVLDVHKAKGFSFDPGEHQSGLFDDEDLIMQFIELWETLAKRYGKEKNVAFELLNEIVDPADNDKWMNTARRTVSIIRHYAPDTKIIIGGYYNNSIVSVKDLAEPFDENIVYTFHCYDPFLFTHQGAYWCEEMDRSFRMKYPVSKKEYIEALKRGVNNSPRFSIADEFFSNDAFDTDYFENVFREAMDVAEKRNVPLYCGEYGVIDLADVESAMNWLKDINSVFRKYNVSRSFWNYRGKDFGLTDARLDGVRDEYIKYL